MEEIHEILKLLKKTFIHIGKGEETYSLCDIIEVLEYETPEEDLPECLIDLVNTNGEVAISVLFQEYLYKTVEPTRRVYRWSILDQKIHYIGYFKNRTEEEQKRCYMWKPDDYESRLKWLDKHIELTK